MFTMQNIAMSNVSNDIYISLNDNTENIFDLSSPSQNMDIKLVIDTDDKKTVSESKNKKSKKIIIKIRGKKRQGLRIVIGDGFVFRFNDYKFSL